MSYHVSAPLVVAKQPNGSDLYLYQGAPVPDGLADVEIKRLEEGDFIEKDGAAAAEESGAPAKSATKDEWVAYAESQGDADAASKTKDQLIADHGA